MLYKISLNTNDNSRLPWRVISTDGVSKYFKELIFETTVYTVSETDLTEVPSNRGWLVCRGDLIEASSGTIGTFI